MKAAARITLALATSAALASTACGDRDPAREEHQAWSRFRGPNGTGIAAVADLPVHFGVDHNVRWREAIPRGKSSPVLGDTHVFLTADEGDELVVLALDRETGRRAWRAAFQPRERPERFSASDAANATPTTDGKNVFVFFDGLGVVAIDARGETTWQVPLPASDSFYGHAGSLVLAGDTLLVPLDRRSGSCLLALDRRTGDVVWERARPERGESWTTPIVHAPVGGSREVLMLGAGWLDSYALDSGEPRWSIPGLGRLPVGSPVLEGRLVVGATPAVFGGVARNFGELLELGDSDGDGLLNAEEIAAIPDYADLSAHMGLADRDDDARWNREEFEWLADYLRPGTPGTVALELVAPGSGGGAELAWRQQGWVSYHATPILLQGLAYLLADRGILTVVNMRTGGIMRRERLSSTGISLTASPVVGDGKMYVATTDGEVFVLSLGARWEVLARNDVAAPIYATPALADGSLWVRTDGHLYAFGETR